MRGTTAWQSRPRAARDARVRRGFARPRGGRAWSRHRGGVAAAPQAGWPGPPVLHCPTMEGDAEPQLVPCVTAPLADAKALLAACEEAEIEAALTRDACCGKGGCGCAPKMVLMVAQEDVPRLA